MYKENCLFMICTNLPDRYFCVNHWKARVNIYIFALLFSITSLYVHFLYHYLCIRFKEYFCK